MGLGLKVAAIPCLIILLVSTPSYSLFNQVYAQGTTITVTTDKNTYQVGEVVTISGTALPTGDTVTIEICQVVNCSTGALRTIYVTPDTSGYYTTSISLNMGTYQVKATYRGETAWTTFQYVEAPIAPPPVPPASISTDEVTYTANSKACINGKNVLAEFPKIQISSGDGSSFWTIFPTVNEGTFRECFTLSTYISNFAYGLWVAELDDSDKYINSTLFYVVPTSYQEKDAGDSVEIQQSGDQFHPCLLTSGIHMKDNWYAVVELLDKNNNVIKVEFPKVNNRSFQYCVPWNITAYKFAILDPSGVFLVKKIGRDDSISVVKKMLLETEKICYTGEVKPNFVGRLEAGVFGHLFDNVPTSGSFEGCLSPLNEVGQWKILLRGWDVNNIQTILAEDDFSTTEAPVYAYNPTPPKEKITEGHTANVLHVKVAAKQIRDLVIVRVTNIGDVGIDAFKILGDSINSAKGPSGWNKAVAFTNTLNMVVQFSNTEPLLHGSKAYFLLKVSVEKFVFDWKAYDNGNVIGEGSVTPIVR